MRHGIRRSDRNLVCRAATWLALVFALVFVTAAASTARAAQAHPEAVDLSGRSVDPLISGGTRPTVLIFIGTTCPISQRYSPEIQRLEREFEPRGVKFWLVDPDPADTASAIRLFLKAYRYPSATQVLRDPDHALVKEAGVQVTPEAAVFMDGRLAYRGRIDNWYVRLGFARRAATTQDLAAALSDLFAGQPVTARYTQAVGCFISDMEMH